jgi:hypothetical protein
MKKHSPGPWTVEVSQETTSVESKYFTIALGVSNDDAHLIAAAPELLEVAKLILAEWEKPTDGIKTGELIARLSQYAADARQAVNKAEGRS